MMLVKNQPNVAWKHRHKHYYVINTTITSTKLLVLMFFFANFSENTENQSCDHNNYKLLMKIFFQTKVNQVMAIVNWKYRFRQRFASFKCIFEDNFKLYYTVPLEYPWPLQSESSSVITRYASSPVRILLESISFRKQKICALKLINYLPMQKICLHIRFQQIGKITWMLEKK